MDFKQKLPLAVGIAGALLIASAGLFIAAHNPATAELWARLTGDEFALAEVAASKHDGPGFLEHINEAIKKNPQNMLALSKRGCYYFYNAHDYAAAQQDFSAVVQLDPHSRYRLLRAQCRRHLNNFTDALADADECLKIPGMSAPTLCEEGAILQAIGLQKHHQGDNADAIKCFKGAEESFHQAYINNPEWAPTLMGMADMDVALTRDFKSAVTLYTEALKYASGRRPFGMEDIREDCFYHRGYAYVQMADFDNALPDFEQCIVVNPQKENYIAGKAYCLNKLRRYGEAINFLRPYLGKFRKADGNMKMACEGLLDRSLADPNSLSDVDHSEVNYARDYLHANAAPPAQQAPLTFDTLVPH